MQHTFGDISEIFKVIMGISTDLGFFLYSDEAKQTIQIYESKEAFEKKEKYLGAIQYEGSNDFEVKAPHIVSWRFKRLNID